MYLDAGVYRRWVAGRGAFGKVARVSSRPRTSLSLRRRAFLVYARAMDYGDRRMSTGTDDELLEIGYAACGVLKTHPVFGAAVQALLKATGKPTVEQAQSLVRESVLNLCPRQKNLLP